MFSALGDHIIEIMPRMGLKLTQTGQNLMGEGEVTEEMWESWQDQDREIYDGQVAEGE